MSTEARLSMELASISAAHLDARRVAEYYAEALIAIVAQPWLPGCYGPLCPYCLEHNGDGHATWCPFPRTARALGIAD